MAFLKKKKCFLGDNLQVKSNTVFLREKKMLSAEFFIAPDKRGIHINIFSYFSLKIYAVGIGFKSPSISGGTSNEHPPNAHSPTHNLFFM